MIPRSEGKFADAPLLDVLFIQEFVSFSSSSYLPCLWNYSLILAVKFLSDLVLTRHQQFCPLLVQ
jgi:hypothetical protein